MNGQYDIVGTDRTKWDVTKDTVNGILNTFSHNGFLNVVTFSDSAAPLWTESMLVRGTRKSKDSLKESLEHVEVGGMANFTEAFRTAFYLLEHGCGGETKSCSDCQRIILFLTDGETGDSIKPSQMNRQIAGFQKGLEESTGQRAIIFTYSITNMADDRIPRQIACRNNGIWSLITGNEDYLKMLNSYFAYVAGARRTDTPIWSEAYDDAGGLGKVTTVALPFYSRGERGQPSIFLGVVGHQVGFHEFLDHGLTEAQALELLVERSAICTPLTNSPCHLQHYRSVHDAKSLCLAPRVNGNRRRQRDRSSDLCYRYGSYVYKKFSKRTSWNNAVSRCRRDGGELVSVEDRDELAFVASLASVDGSWIGANFASIAAFKWLDQSLPHLPNDSDFWASGEPNRGPRDECAAVDNRGVIGNQFSKPCASNFSYICKYTSNTSCVAEFANELSLPSCDAVNEMLERATASPDAVELKSSTVMCDLGDARSPRDVMCCKDPGQDGSALEAKSDTDPPTSFPVACTVFVALAAVGAILSLIGFLIFHSRCFKSRKK